MGLPAIPTRHQDEPAHRQRIAEVVNGITTFQFDDSRVRTQAEITAGAPVVNAAYKPGDVRRYGAVGDGVTDDTAALNAAFSIVGIVARLPAGDYKVTANLAIPVCAGIVGDGWYDTEIIAATGVTLVLSLTGSTAFRCSGFRITGNATTDARGIVCGNASLTSNLRLEDIWVQGFTGTGAIGVEIQDVVTVLLLNPYFNGNTVNLQLGGSSGHPTTVQVLGGAIRTATTKGCLVTSGHNIRFSGTVFEANKHEGLHIETATGRLIEDLVVDGGAWFEDNYFEHVDTGTQVYSAIVDGSDGTASAIFRDVRFSQGSVLSDRKAMKIKIASVALDNARAFYGFAGDFSVEGAGSYVQVLGDIADRCARFISNPDGASVEYPIYSEIIELGTGLSLKSGTWQDWTPTYSSSAGNAATTFTGPGTVTTTRARYVVHKKTCTVVVVFSATLNAVTPSYIALTLPTGITPANSDQYNQIQATNGATAATGIVQARTDNTLRVFKDQVTGSWGSGNACGALITITFEIS